MCAIAGMINCYDKESCLETAHRMKKVLARRGPDQSGVYITKNATLVHTRLAVIDVENGIQPISYKAADEFYTIVYNGELYNADEVRRELEGKGYSFKTSCDTEVVLLAYVCWGEDCLLRFNGIFAFAVWEENAARLFICRDRIGVKPFFYSICGDRFVFASEIKGILQAPFIKAEADINSLAEIMLLGPGKSPGCGIFKNIDELKPAHCGYFANGRLTVKKYWELYDEPTSESFDEVLEKTRFLLLDAIKRQLVSDVPLCTFLSGGLDSSIISAVAAKEYKKQGRRLHTFSVFYRDNEKYFVKNKFQPNADDEYIEIMQKHIDSVHHRIIIDTPELMDSLFLAVEARDLPAFADVDGSLLLFCREVKKHSTVCLSGECADEIFGGYPWYRDKTIRETNGFPWSQRLDYRLSLLKDDLKAKINGERFVQQKYCQTISEVRNRERYTPLELRMKEMTRLNHEWFMQTLLDRKDRMSMYSGLEVRVPFCDHRIAQYLYTVPWEYKDYQGREKGLLRKAAEGLLPESVLWRKKSPYPKTFNPSYTEELKKRLLQLSEDSSSPILGIVKKEKLLELTTLPETVYWYGQLMANPQIMAYLLQVNYWLQKYRVSLV